jgi:ubiquinone/menaquinone biosynthesis C-methylase UbiE
VASRLNLLPPDALIRTGPVDHAAWNHKPLIGAIQRLRFRLALSLLPPAPVDRLLEVGYGGGVFFPELSARCQRLYGADIHDRSAEVGEQLARLGLKAELSEADAAHLPYPDGHFDVVVVVSALEFVEDVEAVGAELARVVSPSGRVVVVTPGRSPVLDLGLWALTGESAKADFGSPQGDRRDLVQPALARHFRRIAQRRYPPVGSTVLPLYTALALSPRRTPI